MEKYISKIIIISLCILGFNNLNAQYVAYAVEDVDVATSNPSPTATKLYASQGEEKTVYMKFQMPSFSGRLEKALLELETFPDARGGTTWVTQIYACDNKLSDGTAWRQEDLNPSNLPTVGKLLAQYHTYSYLPSMDDPNYNTHKFISAELLSYLRSATPGGEVSIAVRCFDFGGGTAAYFIYNSIEVGGYTSRIWLDTKEEHDYGNITESEPLYWQCNLDGVQNVNYITIGGGFPTESQDNTQWKVQYRNSGSWTTVSQGTGGWLNGGTFVWGGASQSPVSADAVRAIFYGNNLKNVNLRGRGGESYLIDDRSSVIKATLIQYVDGNNTVDCEGTVNGPKIIDNCGQCVLPDDACEEDCAGVPGGSKIIDNCGQCVEPENACTVDCNGDINGDAYIDNCEDCVGGNTGLEPCTAPCNLSITNLNPSSFTIVDAAEGETYYDDRTYIINTLPSIVSGSKLIKTKNNEAGSTSSSYVSFDINVNADIYIGYDNRVISTPDWMSSYTPVGETVIISDSWCNLDLYKVAANAGTITCGGNMASGASGAESNYVVFVKENCSGSTTDCNGDEGGSASIDQCGVCSGGNTGLVPNESCTDCNGDINGEAYIDNCEDCVGGNTGLEPCIAPCNLSITNLNPSSFPIVDAAEGVTYYIDRTYIINTLPSIVSGSKMIKTKNNEASSTSSSYLSFDINVNADIYIGYDNRVTSTPDWMSSYTPVGETVIISDSWCNLDLYKLAANAGTITCGGNMAPGASGAESNYVVFVKENCSIAKSGNIDLTSEPEIYPNPFDTYIEISNAHGNIKLYDMYGRVVYQENNIQGDLKIETESLPRGLYLLQIESKNKTEIIELVH